MDIKREISKYINNTSLIQDSSYYTDIFSIKVEYEGVWSNYLEFSLDFKCNNDDDCKNAWISFIWDYKNQELETFIEDIKQGNFAKFDNIGVPYGCAYYDDSPHKIFVLPIDNNTVRFIVVACEDYDNDECLLADTLVDKNILIDQFKKVIESIEKKLKELKQ